MTTSLRWTLECSSGLPDLASDHLKFCFEQANIDQWSTVLLILQNIIENVLMESGYYDMSPCARWEREHTLSYLQYSRWSMTSLRGPGERNFNAVSHKPKLTGTDWIELNWCARWFMGYGIKISFPRPPQWRLRSPGCYYPGCQRLF